MTVVSLERSTSTLPGRLDLPRDGLLRLRAGSAGIRLSVDEGTLLVTREGDPEDHVLSRGDRLTVTGPGLVVAWALAAASVAVSRPAPAGRPAAQPRPARTARAA